jgi:hypothetical protein
MMGKEKGGDEKEASAGIQTVGECKIVAFRRAWALGQQVVSTPVAGTPSAATPLAGV